MSSSRTQVLSKIQAGQKINRIAYQIYEDNPGEKEIILAGIAPNGFSLAKKISACLKKIAPLKTEVIEVTLEKDKPLSREIALSVPASRCTGKAVILVDDVLNSGRTLVYGLRPFLDAEAKKIRVAVLVDRSHKRFPIMPDFVGISLATTMQEHITVAEDGVYLS